MKINTKAVHEGGGHDPLTGAVTTPVYQVSTFQRKSLDEHGEFFYSRVGNPTRKALETAIAGLEGGKHGLAFASGAAAISAVLSLMPKESRVLASQDIYGGTVRLLEQIFPRWGIKADYADFSDMDAIKKAIRPDTRLIWLESPTNPILKIVDIQAVVKEASQHLIPVAVDNTFSTPYFQRPLELGADIVVHSVTKYLAGHSDVIGGAVVTSSDKIYKELHLIQSAQGAVLAPWDCFLTLRGLKTLHVRMDRHAENAEYIARALHKHPAIQHVYHPVFASAADKKIIERQMSGCGGVVSIELKGGRQAAREFLSKLKLFTLADSLGGVESLVAYPFDMSHASVPAGLKMKLGITDSLVRLSIGIEDKEDIKQDLLQALS